VALRRLLALVGRAEPRAAVLLRSGGNVFAGIISRDDGCPWGETGMTTAKWLGIPATTVRIADLIATQPGVLLEALSPSPHIPVGGDPVPHVIVWRGDMYLEDGHHRAVRAALNAHTHIEARILHWPDG
jgi:hypothetical protein